MITKVELDIDEINDVVIRLHPNRGTGDPYSTTLYDKVLRRFVESFPKESEATFSIQWEDDTVCLKPIKE